MNNKLREIKNLVFIIYNFFFICIALFSCRHDKAALERVCASSLPDTVSFSKNILPILQNNCNSIGCHSGINPTGHLNLDTSLAYSQLMQHGKGYIDTINPKYSLFYIQMTSVSKPMPPSGNLDACTTQMVLKWIQQKASKN
ncbi:MAG: hypothetical protein HY840_04440 [Bacteroidetes bacterium]|nr:hypothetical protein [Bacteroidota bacterium]